MSEPQSLSRGCLFLAAVIVVLTAWSARAEETTAKDAALIVTGWLRADADPLGANMGERVADVATFTDPSGVLSHYVVYLEPSGFVVVPADDGVEPIIAFAERGCYDPSRRHPLVSLVTRDLRGRLTQVRGLCDHPPDSLPAAVREARAKWELLRSFAGAQDARDLPEVDDERVPQLLETLWSQCQSDGWCPGSGGYCYNYYTPNHYPCGCVATAMAQVMRYHQHPTEGIGVQSCDIVVDGVPQEVDTIGGDGGGGPYEWDLMVPVPADGATTQQCQAIGALCYDAGVTAGMDYTATRSSAPIWSASRALLFTCGYGFPVHGQAAAGFVTDPDLYEMVNPNLDYRHPVILKLSNGPTDPHAVVADGYGYNAGTLYHHINMGWAGLDDAWYNLPLVAGYTVIDESIYNIFPTGAGEIISGRALDGNGGPVSGVIVTAKAIDGTFTTSAETNENGIYAVAPVPGNTTFRMSATKAGFHTADKLVTTGLSMWYASVSGNRWGVDFTSSVMFVDAEAPGGGDGSSWANAYNCLRDALAAAQQGQQVWVAEGAYRPDQGSGITPNDPNATFTLNNCVTVCGGFAGNEDPSTFDLSLRDLATRKTVLSGDIGILGSVDDNSFHVVTAGGVDPTAILDGCVIQDGNAENFPLPPYHGGGIYIVSGSPTIRNCIFRANRAANYGGGLYCDNGGPELVDCLFTGNFAGAEGGGSSIWGGTPTLMHCTFTDNEALNAGGGMTSTSDATLVNCAFIDNLSATVGGGMVNVNCNPNLVNCTFTNNQADAYGGGMYNVGSNLSIVNCILWGNSDEFGDGEQAQIHTYSGTPTVTYSCIQDDDPDDSYIPYGGASNHNIDDDPWFLGGPTGCYYLSQTSAGQVWQSPCVDAGYGSAGDSSLGSRTTQRTEGPDDNVVDMGFHYAVSGLSFVHGDFDRSGSIDISDFVEFAGCLVGPCLDPPCDPSYYLGPCCSIADFDDSCSPDLADFASFQRAFGE